ncbi:TetR/AcrR family transcriptional regulator [Oceanobacillus halophilus]|uniref:TetR/AcrR family transcriptional regulator n=1 Tax=Oceanobacillus halophilus TaxID=930130 RepID=A0A495A4R4_9BACI|nr:TetR/AcrR family transcriptional regulator [Oceanobacillus halophilus]RKQ33287.1 TetR/AcrR family transcriptional regulator [Oceanobacillus halophilus]
MARERKFTLEELYQATKDTLVHVGYNGFTFSIIAEKLELSRGTIYKYFVNKDELITEYMLYDMNRFLEDLKLIHQYKSFDEQFDYLLGIIFRDRTIQQLIRIASQIPESKENQVKVNLEKLRRLHLDMYAQLEDFIQLGKVEGKIRENLHSGLILGFIFQSIVIPNHFQVPESDWFSSIKDIIRFGIYRQS